MDEKLRRRFGASSWCSGKGVGMLPMRAKMVEFEGFPLELRRVPAWLLADTWFRPSRRVGGAHR